MTIRLEHVSKQYRSPAGSFTALCNVDLAVGTGELVAVVGRSGSGKSTLLNVIGGIDDISGGTVEVAGALLQSMDERRLAAWRGRTIGFVFQFFQLLPSLTAIENVMLPMDFARSLPAARREPRAAELLQRCGVAAQARKLPVAMSGGEQQRVAVARALANEPPVILADEPTGNLDSTSAAAILAIFERIARSGTTVILATHDRDAAAMATRVVELEDGGIVSDVRRAM